MFRRIWWISMFILAACDQEPDYEDGLPKRPLEGEWIQIEPGGDTICSDGTPYRFFVRGGDRERVIIDFQGGGACWNETTCSAANVFYSSQAGTLDRFVGFLDSGRLGGIFDGDASRYFADWTIVHIPYCSGDVHWGDAVREYNSSLTIHHKGFVNAQTVLQWVYTRYPDPESILVSGCSAGAYGAALHSAYVAEHYPDTRVTVFADSGAGIITDDFLTMSLPNWNAQPNLPPFIAALQVPIEELTLPEVYIAIGAHFPEMRMAQTATNYDQDQVFYYTAMGGDPLDWPGRFRSSLDSISGSIPENFRYYVPPGSVHCVSPYPYFYEREVNGVRLDDWLVELVDGAAPPASQACEGEACCDDPICEACAANGNQDAWCGFCDDWPAAWPECSD
jgi:hypothetical protein